ncbi:hypothetical protein NA57DRAFT_54125 [Rhizodiscina lignyota]|uniref:GIY-YIG domain-containing protein n=1 Tax=Rhizodiscina lignyota TaxID=1504668 RepID=A0A9P4ILZ6_9PEZI|nr:hypothetical protein NA57DRAFT_54125 [Rhizodiscina lignyota]
MSTTTGGQSTGSGPQYPISSTCRMNASRKLLAVKPQQEVTLHTGEVVVVKTVQKLGKDTVYGVRFVRPHVRGPQVWDVVLKPDEITLSGKRLGIDLQVTVEDDARSALAQLQISTQFSALGNSKLGRAVTGVLNAIQAGSQGILDFLPQSWYTHAAHAGVAGANLDNIASQFLRGVDQAGLTQVLNQDNFTWVDLCKNGREINAVKEEGNKGIYLRFYFNDKNDKALTYVGATNNFSRRWKQHEDCLRDKNDHSNHYRKARPRNDRHSIVLCRLDDLKDHGTDATLRHIFEQLALMLLQSYDPAVLAMKDRPEETSVDDNNPMVSIMNVIDDKTTAEAFDETAKQAAMKSQWVGGCYRSSFKGVGLNWASPLSDQLNYEKTIWVKQQQHIDGLGLATTYRRGSPFRVTQQQDGNQLLLFRMSNGGRTMGCTAGPTKDGVPPAGTMVQVVWEVAPEGVIHPYSYARLPAVGAFEDWKRAMSLAIRLEWKDLESGSWQYYYCQRTNVLELERLDAPHKNRHGALIGYMIATGVLRFLERRVLPGNPRADDYVFGLARVKEAKYDFYKQTLTFSADLPASTQLWNNNRRSLNDIVNDMKARGLMNVNVPFGQQTGMVAGRAPGQGGQKRLKCDTCYLSPTQPRPECKKYEQPGFKNCIRCQELYGRPCSWTSNSLIDENGDNDSKARYAALIYQPMMSSSIGGMEDPNIQIWSPLA